MHSAFFAQLTSPQTSSVFTVLLLEQFLEPQMYMNSVFLIFLLVSLVDLPMHVVCGGKEFVQSLPMKLSWNENFWPHVF